MLKKFLLLFFMLFFVNGCTRKSLDEEITFATWGSVTEIGIINTIVANFENENPNIKVNVMHIPQNYFQKLHLLFASKTAPDVVFINNLYLPVYSRYLIDLSENINTNNFYKQAIDGMTIDGKLYAIPRDLSYYVFYVNLDKITLPKSDWTIEDLLRYGIETTDKTTFGVSYEDNILSALNYLTYFGGGILDNSGKLIINNSSSKKGISFYKELKDKYHIAPNRSQVGSLTTTQMFLNGNIVFLLSGRWMYPKISEKAMFNWSVINFPNGKFTPCDTSGWAISKSSKHKESALKFVEYISSEKNSEYFAKTGLIVPANKKVSLFLNNDEHNQKCFLEVISNTKTVFVNKDYNKIIDRINDELDL